MTDRSTPTQRDLLRIAVPNKGSLSPVRHRHAARGRLPPAQRHQGAHAHRRRERRRVLLPAPARHRAVRRRGHARRRHHRPRPAARLRRQGRGGARRSASAAAVPLRRPARPLHRRSTDLAGTRIATSYVGVVRQYLEERGIDATVIRLDGAVETSVQLGVADVIADVVETGSTLRQAGLEIFGEAILESEAVLITRGRRRRRPGSRSSGAGSRACWSRAAYVMMDYDIPSDRVAEAVALTPGIESPTVSPLHREGWVAVRAMVPRAGAQRLMDELCDHRRPRHPGHRHPCLPSLSRRRPALPHTWRPLGVRLAGVVLRRPAGRGLRRRLVRRRRRASAAGFTPFQRGDAGAASGCSALAAWCALVRCRVTADRRRARRRQRLPPPRATSGPRCSPCTCRRARRSRPSTSPTAPAVRPWAIQSRRRRPGQDRGAPAADCCSTADRRASHSSARIPQETETSSPGSPAGASVTQVAAAAERVRRRRHRLDRQRLPRRVPAVVGAEDHQPGWCRSTHSATPRPVAGSRTSAVATPVRRRARGRRTRRRGGVAHRPRHPEVVGGAGDVLLADREQPVVGEQPGRRRQRSAPSRRPGRRRRSR